jgi:D-glycerate 3-kinase
VEPELYSARERAICLHPLLRLFLARRQAGETVVVGIQGGQGTGKTTLSAYLSARLEKRGCSVVSFSLDDFYGGAQERRRLAALHPGNPFFQLPRGMPGTHRTDELLRALSRLKAGRDVNLPIFDKSARSGEGEIAETTVPVRGRRDFVLFEGWCVGIPEATPEDLAAAVRRHRLPSAPGGFEAVLGYLGPYQALWEKLDGLVMLYPDSPKLHERWRLEQERDLRSRLGSGLDEEQVREMVRLFLPFTYLCYDKLEPAIRLHIDSDHRCYRLTTGRIPDGPGSRW